MLIRQADKRGKISFLFTFVCIICIFIYFYFHDFKTAAVLLIAYAVIRIIANFMRKDRRSEYYE